MEKGEKSSPSPSRGLHFFDTANLLGPSPFSASAGLAPQFAHLAHIPSAFSMLGRIPPFPAPPPFGGLGALGDPLRASTALAHSSCASTGSFLHNAFTSSSPLSLMSSLKPSTSLTSPSSSTSSKAASSKASNSSTATSGRHGSSSRKSPLKDPGGKQRSRHRSSNSQGTPTATVASSPHNDGAHSDKKSQPSSPFLHSSLYAAHDLSKTGSERQSGSDNESDMSSASSLSSDDSSASSGDDSKPSPSKKKKNRSHKHSRAAAGGPTIQIDGAKKQLMADQIRQKMQGKLSMPPPPLLGGAESQRPRGKGRGARNSHYSNTDDETEEEKKKKDELRRQLEAGLKEQQLQLKLLKHAQAQREKEAQKEAALNLHKSGGRSKGPAKISQLLPFTKELERARDGEHFESKFNSFNEFGSESNLSELSSDSDLEMDNGTGSAMGSTGDSDDSEQGRELLSEDSGSPAKGNKRAADGSIDGRSCGKRRRVMDEKELRIPLEHGWRRETRIRHVGSRGIAGEVVYYAPCGKKLKTYPDVTRYLDRNAITDLTRENFTFSSKYNIGDFMEARHGENGFTVLTEEEVLSRMMWADEKRQNRTGRSQQRHDMKRRQAQDTARQAIEIKLRRKLEQQEAYRSWEDHNTAAINEIARRSAEIKLFRKLERQRQKEEEKRSKQQKVLEKKKQKDQLRMMKQHEKVQRQEQLRMEREMRAQQILEARRRRKEDIEKSRYEEALRKAQDREMKRQQAVLLKEQEREWQKQMMIIANMERERRRQHMLLVKALEARKKQEEKDRVKEERKAEKVMIREKKIEQKRLEMRLADELKQPREDLELRDLKPLPEMDRLAGVKLPGQALADCIMVLEFLNTFGEALGFDHTSMPNLDTLQKGLMNETEDDVEELMSIFTHLTQFAVDDPGVPNPKQAQTKMGQKISDVEITDTVVSEVLRVFIRARAGKQHELCQLLLDKPIEALNCTQKAAILAFLCNELLCSRVITSEIDNNIESMANLRRDKWVVEGKLRKLRLVQSKKFNRPEVKRPEAGESNSGLSVSMSGGWTDGETSMSQAPEAANSSKHGSDAEDEESGHESDNTDVTSVAGNVSEEDDPGTVEECEKKIEKLTKQHRQYRNKVFSASHKLRGMCFGQDRYMRWYWVLPYLGGVFVEGQESGQPRDQLDHGGAAHMSDVDQRTVELKQQLERCKQEIIKLETGELEEGAVKTEPLDPTNLNHSHSDTPLRSSTPLSSHSGKMTPVKSENGLDYTSTSSTPKPGSLCNGDVSSSHTPVCKSEEKHSDTDTKDKLLLSEKPGDDVHKSEKDIKTEVSSDVKSEVSSEERTTKNSSPHCMSSPITNGTSNPETTTVPETKPSFLSIDSMLKKDDNGPSLYNNHFLPSGLLPEGPFSAEQMLKNLSDRQSHKPWFSILPRLSCDGSSADHSTIPTTPDLSQAQLNSPLSFLSPMSFPAFSMQSPTFPSFQMGQIGVSASDYNLLPLTPKNSGAGDSFKVPSTPAECPVTSSPAPSDLLKYEPAEPIPIPEDAQRGWWRISQSEQFKTLVRALHPRGIRERDLQKAFQKSFDFVCQSCSKGNREALEIEKSEEEEEEETKEEELVKKGEESPNEKEKPVENGEEPMDKEEDPQDETEPQEKAKSEEGSEVTNDTKPSITKPVITAPPSDEPDSWNPSVAFDIETAILEEVEALEDRIFTASLQIKGWKLPQKLAELEDIEPVNRANTVLKQNQVYPLTIAKDKLFHLEKNIERRYLKPPFTKTVQIKVENITAKTAESHVSERRRVEEDKKEERAEDSEEEDRREEEVRDTSKEKLPAGLVLWRSAVASASSPAQLALCLQQLNRCIYWEKSIMKVLCQLCRKDDNEAELLLCDSCDKGYHTYCFKPKMVSIPDGDWYCYECISKATGFPHCAVCGKKTGRLFECGTCPRALHMDCMETPLAKAPKKWFCAACTEEKSKNKKSKKKGGNKKEEKPEKETKKDRRTSESISEVTTPESKSKKGKSTAVVDIDKDSVDLEPCRVLMVEMEKHADSWPFLQPVNTKQFPQYKKYIKHPMDFSTMRNKLRDNGYKCRGEFASDARLVFDNCETFNEDDSEVGKAGHNMRRLFEERWRELCAASTS